MIFSPSSSLGTNLINASALEKKARPWSWHSTSPSQLPCQPPQPPTHTPCSFSHLYLRLFCMLVTFSTERIGEGLAPSCRHPSLVPHPTLCNLDPFNYVYRVEKPVVLRLRDTSNFASQPQQRVRCHWNTLSNGHRWIICFVHFWTCHPCPSKGDISQFFVPSHLLSMWNGAKIGWDQIWIGIQCTSPGTGSYMSELGLTDQFVSQPSYAANSMLSAYLFTQYFSHRQHLSYTSRHCAQ